ncbi:DUF1800 domain-containing protein [Lapillicoccus jejuensis]|uniref:Uncharacterized protein DUF1800 n=1 Tax=Lapillicoccus jejuensis TaxID=402171 RepID=A0A542E043_9MICO|nr:DUF1800 domain-containing protein [Lapillicoccus jejuensis]TQJ08676.1 uncharacterized protein DUF1800 [Lapillicoccus jejuensis]
MRPSSDARPLPRAATPAPRPAARRSAIGALVAAALDVAGRAPGVRMVPARPAGRGSTPPAVPTDPGARARAMTTPARSVAARSAEETAGAAATAARTAAVRGAATSRVAALRAAGSTTSAAATAAAAPGTRRTTAGGTRTPSLGRPTGTGRYGGVGAGFATVAGTTRPTAPKVFVDDAGLHLLRRATFGPRPSDLADLRALGIDEWLSRQLDPATIPDPEGDAAWALFPLAGASAATVHAQVAPFHWDAMFATGQATLARQVFSRRQLLEVVVDVMADHLHVACPSEGWDTVPSYVTDVIRPLAMGRYRDLLKAAMRHPAMLGYLNNDVSSKSLVNENLGRELLELHTVGRGAGYTEADVVASAKVLTGRSQSGGVFAWKPTMHWVGPLTVLGWSSPNASAADGLAVGDSYLDYLAGHPATARTIARKLAVRFVGDDPPAELLDRLAAAYLANDTSVRAVLQTLFRSAEFWASVGQKTRRPLEDVVGTARVLDLKPGTDTAGVLQVLYWMVRSNGHAPLGWGPPNGYPDVAAAWGNAGSFVQRMTIHRGLVNGWWKGVTTTPVLQLVPVTPGMTAGQWVDALSVRLLGQRMTTAHRDAVLGFAPQVTAASPMVNASWYAWGLVPLLLDSPYFQLR